MGIRVAMTAEYRSQAYDGLAQMKPAVGAKQTNASNGRPQWWFRGCHRQNTTVYLAGLSGVRKCSPLSVSRIFLSVAQSHQIHPRLSRSCRRGCAPFDWTVIPSYYSSCLRMDYPCWVSIPAAKCQPYAASNRPRQRSEVDSGDYSIWHRKKICAS